MTTYRVEREGLMWRVYNKLTGELVYESRSQASVRDWLDFQENNQRGN